MAKLPETMSSAKGRRTFIVGPDGIVRLGAANDDVARTRRRQDVAASTSTPDGLASFIETNGLERAAELLHDAMFGRGAAADAKPGTPAGSVAKSWDWLRDAE